MLKVQEILTDRTKEEVMSEVEISIYDTMRNEKAKKHRKELVCTLRQSLWHLWVLVARRPGAICR